MITLEKGSNVGVFSLDGVDYPKGQYVLRYDYPSGDSEDRRFSLVNRCTGEQIISARYFDYIEGVSSWSELSELLVNIGAIAIDATDVNTVVPKNIVIASLGQEKATTTLSAAIEVGDTVINVTSSTGMAAGNNLFIENGSGVDRFEILSISDNAITVDTPAGNAHEAGEPIGASNINMNIDGSTTPVKFNLKTSGIGSGITFDTYRIILVMRTTGTGDIEDFGDITNGLTKGIYLRKKDGNSNVIFNAKRNIDFVTRSYDMEPFSTGGFFGGNNGWRCRMTFTKMGSSIRIAEDEDIELWVQDNLSSLLDFEIIVEGIIVN